MPMPTIDLVTTIGASAPRRAVSCRVAEGMSRITRAVVEIATEEDVDFRGDLAGPAKLVVQVDGADARAWSLCLARAELVGLKSHLLRYELELQALPYLLSLRRDTRKFRRMSHAEVISKLLDEARIPYAWRTTRALDTRKYCVQYNETTLDFVHRLLEFEGVYYTFDDDGTIVFQDASGASPPVRRDLPSHFELIAATGALAWQDVGIFELEKNRSICTGTATVGDFDWKKPQVPLLKSSSADRDAELEVYEYPAGYRDPEEGARIASLRLEAFRARASHVDGKSNIAELAPSRSFTFGANAGVEFEGAYVVVDVEHAYRDRRFASSEGTDAPTPEEDLVYGNRFQAIPRSVPFRPALVTPRPQVAGSHTAMVRGPAGAEIHTDRYGRFKAEFHWDREGTGTDLDSRWMRMVQESATSMGLARVGWEVGIGYVHGDPDRPLGVARLINGVMTPIYGQPSNKNMMAIRTPSSPASGGYNEIKLDDSAGSMAFSLRAEKDYVGVTENDKSERIGNNETHSVGANLARSVGRNQRVSIGANHTVTAAGDRALEVGGNRTKTVGASESIDVKRGATVSVKGDEAERVGTVRTTIAGGPATGASLKAAGLSMAKGAAMGLAMGKGLPSLSAADAAGLLVQGSITRSTGSSTSRTVGGAFISVALQDITTKARLALAETVGGAKITISGKSIAQSVGGPMALTVGGAILRSATSDVKCIAKNTKVNVGSIVMLTAADKVSIEAAEITLEGAAALSFDAADLGIALSPSKVTVKGDVKLEGKKRIVVTGSARENLTKG
jgi:type VI secretion system secreted protein VgrG